MKSFSVTTQIQAEPETIWRILTDAPNYPSWNPTVDKVDGRIEPGQKVTVYAKINPGRAFPVKVAEFVPPKRMVWTGGMPLGLFKGERTFTLTPGANGAVEFSMREVFSGLFSPLIERSIPDQQPAFNQFAAALKKQAESRTSGSGR
jgi:hypothetical protein